MTQGGTPIGARTGPAHLLPPKRGRILVLDNRIFVGASLTSVTAMVKVSSHHSVPESVVRTRML